MAWHGGVAQPLFSSHYRSTKYRRTKPSNHCTAAGQERWAGRARDSFYPSLMQLRKRVVLHLHLTSPEVAGTTAAAARGRGEEVDGWLAMAGETVDGELLTSSSRRCYTHLGSLLLMLVMVFIGKVFGSPFLSIVVSSFVVSFL